MAFSLYHSASAIRDSLPSQQPAMLASSEEAMAANRNRLMFKFFRLAEGEAEGRFAISALVAVVLAALTVSIMLMWAAP